MVGTVGNLMATRRWDAIDEALSLRDAMHSLFEQAVRQPTSEATPQTVGGGFAPALDFRETPDDYLVEVSLAGVDPKEVTIEFHQGTLTISGEVMETPWQPVHEVASPAAPDAEAQGQPPARPQPATYYVRERHHGRFYRSMTLPGQVNSGQAEASFEHGVLTLRMPKVEAMKPRRIPVRSANTTPQPTASLPSTLTKNGNGATAHARDGSAAAKNITA